MESTSPWAPFEQPTFRMLWVVWVTAHLCMWMNDVASAWMMTSLTTKPLLVALVQSAATLPVFLFGLPSGALADILDRRRYFMFTQFWAAGVALVLALLTFTGTLNATLLLLLVFANGIGLAMRWPVFAALTPEVVPRHQLMTALAMNGVAGNLARIVGPLIAGALIAAAGSKYVFALNALLCTITGVMLARWKRPAKVSPLPSERFIGAMRVGLQHVRQSSPFHLILLRTVLFFMQSISLVALLPLVARDLHGGGAGTYTVLLAAMGAGAVTSALLLPRLRQLASSDQLFRNGSIVFAIAMVATALAPHLVVAVLAMGVAGFMWLTVINSFTTAAQTTLPDWVRARGMAIYQMVVMGSGALGAAVWGQVASITNVHTSLLVAAVTGAAGVLVTRRMSMPIVEEDMNLLRGWKAPELAVVVDPQEGPVLVTVEYHIDPERASEFEAIMRESRRQWLAHGLLAWELFEDVARPGCYIEHFIDESWAEYVRRNERMTAGYAGLRERKQAMHVLPDPPAVRRFVARRLTRS
jgi:MFS family permease